MGSDCIDFKYGKCDEFEGAFETVTPVGGLANCQDFFCGDIFASICHTFVYNRKDDACYIFDRDAVSPVCKIHSGVSEDEHEECDNSANGCDHFTEFECIYEGKLLEDFPLDDEDTCKRSCHGLPQNNTYYIHDADKSLCECRDSKATQECDYIRGPQKPSFTTECGNPDSTTTSTSPTSTELPLCSKTQLSIQETMSLQKFYGNESNCMSVTDPNVCSVCSCDDWEFNDLKTVVTQHNQSFGSIGIGSEFVMGVNFNGTFNTSSGDDDFIGFIFGFQDPSHFYIVYAAKFNVPNNHWTQYQFGITKVNSISGLNGLDMINAILDKTSSVQNQTEILWKDTEDRGWLQNKEYTWNLKFRPLNGQLRLELYEDSVLLFDTGILTNNFENDSGKLG